MADGTELTITATPSEGYHFEQWSDGNTDNPRTIRVDTDITLAAEFGINTYKLVYNVDGSLYKEYDVNYGTAITPEELPEKEGHSFSGWDNVPATMPAHDVTVNGTFSVNSYNLNFYLNGELYRTELVEYGSELKIIDPEVPEGKKFDGWIDEIPETMPAHDVDIYGTYSDMSLFADMLIDDSQRVVICTLNGFVIYKNVFWHGVQAKLESGLYIINGTKFLIRR